jgi:hypothetical protein
MGHDSVHMSATSQGDPPVPSSGYETWSRLLSAAGLGYLAFGLLLAVVYVGGGVHSSLFPTGWLFPALLIVTGILMTARRRFDIVATLWGGFTLAVFVLAALIYTNALDLGLDDAAAFDATLIAAAFGLVVLVLRPGFRS